MAAGASDKTFHLKWNNHLQNLSQLFTTIYSSSALADVTLSCRDGTIKAHKLVLSACSPYFEQLFKDNPCKHPIVILKGIPYQEINSLVEFMYKGSVDVQELDLQSLMHTASELEIRGLAYEIRANASQLLNINLEYPTDGTFRGQSVPTVPDAATVVRTAAPQTDLQRLKEIHLYQQQQVLLSRQNIPAAKKRRLDEDGPNPAVDNILAAAAKEIALKKKVTSGIQTEEDNAEEHPKQKKRVSFGCIESEDGQSRQIDTEGFTPLHFAAHFGNAAAARTILAASDEQQTALGSVEKGHQVVGSKLHQNLGSVSPPSQSRPVGGIKVVNLSQLQNPIIDQPSSDSEDSDNLLEEKSSRVVDVDAMEESESIDSEQETYGENKPHKCDICEMRFSRGSHLARHKLKHTGERPYGCGGCGRSFSRSDKLRMHKRICEKNDPTVELNVSTSSARASDEVVRPGCVRTSHPDSAQLVFTAAGDVVLAKTQNQSVPSIKQELNNSLDGTPGKRGRGRPRKNPLPDVPKIKKKRGRPPKLCDAPYFNSPNSTSTSMSISPGILSSAVATSIQNMATTGLPTMVPTTDILPSQDLLLKRKRGRPPKNFFQPRLDTGDPKENYNATNLPFGDFNFLMYNAHAQYALNQYQTLAANQHLELLNAENAKTTNANDHSDKEHEKIEVSEVIMNENDVLKDIERTIDLSSSSSSEEDNAPEPEKKEEKKEEEKKDTEIPTQDNEQTNPPEIMTVGDCEIVKLPQKIDECEKKTDDDDEQQVNSSSEVNDVTITPVKQVDECTIQPIDGST